MYFKLHKSKSWNPKWEKVEYINFLSYTSTLLGELLLRGNHLLGVLMCFPYTFMNTNMKVYVHENIYRCSYYRNGDWFKN